jgi:hypothetical protein
MNDQELLSKPVKEVRDELERLGQTIGEKDDYIDRLNRHIEAERSAHAETERKRKLAVKALEIYANPETIDLCQEDIISQVQFTRWAKDAIAAQEHKDAE